MINSEEKPPPPVGASWIKEEDYPALLQLFNDGDKMPPSWKEWLKMAEEMEQGLKAYGNVVLRVYIDPATFPDWCAAHDGERALYLCTAPRSLYQARIMEDYVLDFIPDCIPRAQQDWS